MHADTTRLELSFHGRAREYFKIWIVNLCLSVLTLGLYAPWAKVRSRQYFYSRTLLDGTPFRYHAPPVIILKGRLIAAVIFAGFYGLTEVLFELGSYVHWVAVLALPWMVTRALRFEAGHSSYRNLRFEFDGEYGSGLRALLGALLLALTGVGFPWAECRIRSYLVRHLSYGGVRARLGLRGERLFAPFMLAVGVAIGGVVLGSVLALKLFREPWLDWAVAGFVIVLYVACTAGFWLFRARSLNAMWRGVTLGPVHFDSSLRARDLIFISVTNTLAILLSLGLLLPWAKLRAIRYRIQQLEVSLDGDWLDFERHSEPVAPGHALGTALTADLQVIP